MNVRVVAPTSDDLAPSSGAMLEVRPQASEENEDVGFGGDSCDVTGGFVAGVDAVDDAPHACPAAAGADSRPPADDGGIRRDVGVAIVTYASGRTIERCLRALPAERLGRIVVLDNASPDDTVTVIQRSEVAVELVEQRRNTGFGAGCNAAAARLGDMRWIIFVNPDAVVSESAVSRLVSYAEAHPDAACFGARMYEGDVPLISASTTATMRSEIFYVLPQRFRRLGRDRRHQPDYARSGAVGSIEGACMLVDREAFEASGGFDERYFLFFEEQDLARRLGRSGREVHLVADAAVDHASGESRSKLAHSGRDHYFESTVRYLRTWRGVVPTAGYLFVAVPSLAYEVVAGAMKLRDAAAYARAMWRGLWT